MIETEAYKKHKEMIRSLLPQEEVTIYGKALRDMNLRAGKKVEKKKTKKQEKKK